MNVKDRHAYLIIAHEKEELLRVLIRQLDHVDNDIYIHIDKKAPFDGSSYKTKFSALRILEERIDARWGDYSLVEVELLLFRFASSHGAYSYYHLLSGVDMPIKSQEYIHKFCKENYGKEFIGYANISQEELRYRSSHIFLFSRLLKSRNLLIRSIRFLFIKIQDLIGYDRNKDCVIMKGSQWCSLTNNFVSYLLDHQEDVERMFKRTFCPDEMFIHTICWNSTFKDKIYNSNVEEEFDGCKRYINWVNGELLPITKDDIEVLNKSNGWFARKFMTIDEAISITNKVI